MGESNDVRSIKINSYQKVWNFEKKIYKIFNIPMITPAAESDVLYFLVSLGIVSLFRAIFKFPLPSTLFAMLFYVGLPLAITSILRYKTFDGKNPLVFLSDYVKFFFVDRTRQLEFFIQVTDAPEHLASWDAGYRHRLRKPKERRKNA